MRNVGRLLLLTAFAAGLAILTADPSLGEGRGDARTGSLSGIGGHGAAGRVHLTTTGQGTTVLIIREAEIDRIPDGRVYLTRNFDHTKGVELSRLTTFSGTLTFPVPASVDLNAYDSVVIWCKKFDVGIGQARFSGSSHTK